MSEAPNTPPADPNTPPADPNVSKPWFDGADPETVGHIQTKGWHDKPANVVALEAIKAHREAERHLGVPADRILKLPKDTADTDGWKAVYERLGKPAKADDYDFSAVKFSDGAELGDDFVGWLRGRADALNLSKDGAVSLAQDFVKYLEGSDSADAAERTAKLAEEHKTLDADWGQNKEANLFVAKQAAAKLGVSPEAVAALEGQVGYANVMNMFLKIGQQLGEAKFVSGGVNPNGVMTREQAVARKAELMADSVWAKKYLDGDAAANREMLALNTLIVGDDTEASRSA